MPDMPSLRGAWRSFWAVRAWDDRHRRLASLPPLAGWQRDDIRHLVSQGDEVAVTGGEVLLSEDTIGYWFVLVVDGTLAVTRGGRRLGSLSAGGHAGEVAILGFGPQPATVTAATDCRIFVMGRRELLSMADRSRRLQLLLFPDVAPNQFRPFLRRLRIEGTAAWRRVPRPVREQASRPPRGIRPPRPGRRVSGQGTFSRMAAAAFRRDTPERTAQPAAVGGLSGRAMAAVAAALVGIALVAATLFHPPVVVVSVAEPIDVTRDLAMPHGMDHDPLTGTFVLTAVDLRQPSLTGATWARLRGDRVLPLTPTRDNDAVTLGKATFANSQRLAVDAAADALGLPGQPGAGIAFESRDLQGPSAALVYALVAADLLSPADLARGRTIAATGTLDADGRVGTVGFSAEKLDVAERAGADVFVVPAGQSWPRSSQRPMRVIQVRTLAEAIAALRAPS